MTFIKKGLKEIFPSKTVGIGGLLLGLVYLVVVWTLLGLQAFQPGAWHPAGSARWEGASEADLRVAVFIIHSATVLFVIIEAVVAEFRGNNGIYAHFTIGSGILATLLQVVVVASAATTAAFNFSTLALAFQSYANSLMLGFIIADLRGSRGYTSVGP